MKSALGDELICIVSENEPAYWAFEGSDEKYPVKRTPLWADFNPHTVADAKREGVILDPADGLDMTERVWFQRNLARYIKETIDVIHAAEPGVNIYTHALLDYTHFPLAGTGHARPYAEVAHAPHARLGVEMLWKTDFDALWRIREWGKWANVNREEYDGYSFPYHVATLQSCYIMGADMLNSYNWQPMGREGDPIRYFNEFINNVGSGGRVILAADSEGEKWYPLKQWHGKLKKNDAFPWCNQIELYIRCTQLNSYLHLWLTKGKDGPIVSYRLLDWADFGFGGPTTIDLGDIAQLQQEDSIYLHLNADKGWEFFGSRKQPTYKLICNLPRERRRSRYVIDRPADVAFTPLPLVAEEP